MSLPAEAATERRETGEAAARAGDETGNDGQGELEDARGALLGSIRRICSDIDWTIVE